MRILNVLIIATLVPSSVYAQEVTFLVEEVFASEPVGTQEPGVGGLTGRQAREYRERLQKQYEAEASASSSSSILDGGVASEEVPVEDSRDSIDSGDSREKQSIESFESPESLESSSSSIKPYIPPTPLPQPNQEEQDRLTLEQLEEYRNEAYANKEEQMQMLENGFTVTSTSSLGSPLSSTQRAAVLRRTVRTAGQLKLFARALAESDDNIRKIEVNMGGITVNVRRKAWVFGFLPVNYILDIHIENSIVSAEQPWWHAFSRDGVANTLSDLQAVVHTPVEGEEDELQTVLDTAKQALQAIAEYFQQ